MFSAASEDFVDQDSFSSKMAMEAALLHQKRLLAVLEVLNPHHVPCEIDNNLK